MSAHFINHAIVLVGCIVLPLSLLLCGVLLADRLGAKPFRWISQSRNFINALDMAHKRGLPYEEALIKLADFGERDLGLQFHLLAAWLREGLKLHEALPLVPKFLPRPMQALVVYGSQQGRLDKLIPVAQRSLQEITDRTANNRNEIFGLLAVALALFGVIGFLSYLVIPKFAAVIADMLPGQVVFFHQLYSYQNHFLVFHGFVVILMALAFLFMVGGTANHTYMENRLPRITDFLHRFFPWQRVRQHQRFGRMLATLLDQKVPEDQALEVAGAFAVNRHFRERIDGCIADVRAGRGLIDALNHVGLDGDFKFRMRAAHESGKPFAEALDEWFTALHVRAQLRERAITDFASTFFTVYNAVVVGLVAYAFFEAEVHMINLVTAW